MLSTIENVPLSVNVLNYVNKTGWSLINGVATHEDCSAGKMYVRGFNLLNAEYEITYTIKSISGGYVQLVAGGSERPQRTTPGFYTETIVATKSEVYFYAPIGASVEISTFTYKKTGQSIDPESKNTIAYSETIDKWTSFYTYNPDLGFSLKRNLFTTKEGKLYKHDVLSPRNTFYGAAFDSRVEFTMNQALNVVKNLQGIEIQANTLLITTEDGIKTSLGQVSDLFAEDFEQFKLSNGVASVDVYDQEGVYYANFLRDKNTDIIEGDRLKGNYVTIELTTTDNRDFKLYKVYVKAEPSYSGI